MAKKNGKKKLIEMTSSFYEADRKNLKGNAPKLELIDLGTYNKTYIDIQTENEYIRLENSIENLVNLFGNKTDESISIVVERFIQLESTLTKAELFDILTDGLSISYNNLPTFFEKLHRGARDYFTP
tara:strand:- start:33 stop:413 length:381 start_codon:yes stop_codon:yes gene_type:complete